MKNIGIIAEFNPFHNGHQYIIEKAKELFPEKKVVTIMSGSFVQRGDAAIYNKYTRTKTALACGADLVFELPFYYAMSNAETFAGFAVKCLAATGLIDTLVFGAETDDIGVLTKIADLLANEPYEYKEKLSSALKSGKSYPAAVQYAAEECLNDDSLFGILSSPNNILAIEYIKAIIKNNLDIKPIAIKRIGNDHNSTDFSDNYSSATAIRNNIDSLSFDDLSAFIPKNALDILKKDKLALPLSKEDFYEMLIHALFINKGNYNKFADLTDDIANIIDNIETYPESFDALVKMIQRKNLTYARISRALMNILFEIKKENVPKPSYLKILGFKKDSSYILKDIDSVIPIITKTADAKNILTSTAFNEYQNDISKTDLYNQVFFGKYHLVIPSDYKTSPIII